MTRYTRCFLAHSSLVPEFIGPFVNKKLVVLALLLFVGCHKDPSIMPRPYDIVTEVFVDKNIALSSSTTGIIINGPSGELAEAKTAIILLNHGCQIMERSKLSSIVGEQKLQLSGLVEESQAIEVGKLAGVNAIFIGAITLSGKTWRYEATNMAFTGKLINVKTGKIIITGFSGFDDLPEVGLNQAVSWTIDGYFNKVFNK